MAVVQDSRMFSHTFHQLVGSAGKKELESEAQKTEL